MKLSIITINRNNAAGLRDTMQSVVSQISRDFEYIVVDGASTDDSVEVIKELAPLFGEGLKWISEPDSGIFSAMNKGIRMAEGTYCLFLNSGDSLYDNKVVEDFIQFDGDEDIISGREYLPQRGQVCEPPQPEMLTYDYFVDNVLLHQSTFIKRELLLHHGGYSECYRIVSDWEFWMKALVQYNATYKVFPRIVANYDVEGISNQQKYINLKLAEEKDALQITLPRVYPNSVELRELRQFKKEYEYLKNGKTGWLVKLAVWLKRRKKNDTAKYL